jgi:hypothetical protein
VESNYEDKMTPLEKTKAPLPAEIIAEIQAVIAENKAEYDSRTFDYVCNVNEEYGRTYESLEQFQRGSQEWEESVPEAFEGGCWWDHFTGDKTECFNAETFQLRIEDAADDIIWHYITADEDVLLEDLEGFSSYETALQVVNDLLNAGATITS